VIIKNYRRDGSPFWNRTHISPMRDEEGKISLIIGLQTEVLLIMICLFVVQLQSSPSFSLR
jgi:hypothetical protein